MGNEKDMSLDLRPEIARGVYSNLALITHSQVEVILDFASMLPGMPKPEVVSRVIMHPEHAKRLLYALKDNLDKYENQFGTINLESKQERSNQKGPGFPMGGFGSNGAQS